MTSLATRSVDHVWRSIRVSQSVSRTSARTRS